MSLIEDFMPRWDVTERNRIVVCAQPATVFAAAQHVDLRRSHVIAVRPFSGWIRKEMLRLIKEDAERRG